MTYPSKAAETIFVIPRPDGILISIDGKCFLKEMTSKQFFYLANDCTTAAIAVLRVEEMADAMQTGS